MPEDEIDIVDFGEARALVAAYDHGRLRDEDRPRLWLARLRLYELEHGPYKPMWDFLKR